MTALRFRIPGILLLGLLSLGGAQTSDRLVSKSIPLVFPVLDQVSAFAEDGATFSRVDVFPNPPLLPGIRNGTWPWSGGAQAGAPYKQSLVLGGSYFISDSESVARAASVFYDARSWKGDSLIFRDPQDIATSLAHGASINAAAVRGDTAILGFGRLGLVSARLVPDTQFVTTARDSLVRDSLAVFRGFPTNADTALTLIACRWNRLCRADTVTLPAAGLDSVTSVAVDSSAPDSVWLLVGTTSGLRRGLIGGRSFPHIPLPGQAGSAVRSVFASSSHRLAWAFTNARFFYSDDHGATFRTVPAVPGASHLLDTVLAYASVPQAAFSGDTTFVNFTLNAAPGLARFRRDTVLTLPDTGIDQVVMGPKYGLDLSAGDALTMLAVVRSGGLAALAAGSTSKGMFYRRLDNGDTAFSNLNRLRALKSSLNEVITFPTLYSGFNAITGAPEYVHFGYRLKKTGKVTITVFNYSMEKVKVVVKNAARQGGVPRSENAAEDRWDGRDSGGRLVSVGTYYVQVESDQGESSFGKVICVRGRE